MTVWKLGDGEAEEVVTGLCKENVAFIEICDCLKTCYLYVGVFLDCRWNF